MPQLLMSALVLNNGTSSAGQGDLLDRRSWQSANCRGHIPNTEPHSNTTHFARRASYRHAGAFCAPVDYTQRPECSRALCRCIAGLNCLPALSVSRQDATSPAMCMVHAVE